MLANQINLFANVTPLSDGIIYTPRATDQEIKQFIQRWCRSSQFAIDIETYGSAPAAPLDPWRGHIRTIQIGLRGQDCLVADLGGWNDDRADFQKRLEELKFFDTLRSKVSCQKTWSVGHNLQFELQWLYYKYKIQAWKCADTMLLSQIYWAGIKPYRHSLKAVCERLDVPIDKTEQKSDWGWDLSTEQINYAANDVRVLFEVWDKLGCLCSGDIPQKLIDKYGAGEWCRWKPENLTVSVNADFGALPGFAEMGVDGFPVDGELLDEYIEVYQAAANKLEQPFREAFPGLTVDDTAKLPQAIQEKLGINVDNSDKNALNPHRDNPVISSLLSARSIGAYLDYLKNMKLAYRDGSVRGGFRQNAPMGRGRSTSGGGDDDEDKPKRSTGNKDNGVPAVNLQNPPNPSKACPEVAALNLPPVRSLFRPPAGYKLLVVDLSAAHARIAAQTTQDKLFIASYNEGVDVHAIVASKLSTLAGKNWSVEDISRIRKQKNEDGALATLLRNIAKNVFYGWLNGAGIAKTAETIRVGGYACTKEFAESVLVLLAEKFPDIRRYHDRIKQGIKRNIRKFPGCQFPYTWAKGISGRRVFLPVFPVDEKGRGGAKPTDAVMVAWMGTEADAVKMAMHKIRLESSLHPEWELRQVNICHDELDYICREEYAEEAGYVVWLAMQSSLAYFVRAIPAYEDPYKPENVVCNNWSEK